MAKIRQSLAWWTFANKMGADDLLNEAKRIGYEGVEMVPRDLWDKVREAGLRIVTEGGHQHLHDGLNNPANHDRIEKEIESKLALAQQFDIPCLIVFSGNRNGLPDAAGLENTAQGLQRVAHAAEQAGVTLILELLNSKVDHADYQCDHTSWGASVIEAVNSPRVKLLYDIYHMQIMEGDLIRTLRDNIAHIGHFHTAGNPGRHEIDDTQEIYYPAVCRAIAATDYTGYVGQEFSPQGNALASLEQAFKLCNV